MPSCPRKDIVAKGQVGVYHCWNRCVQRAFLCGNDPVTGENYNHRRDWIEQTEQILAGLFAIEIAFHAEMANHIHLIVRTRPEVADGWSDEDVVRRWLIITKLKRNGSAQIVEPTETEMAEQLNRPGRVQQLRRRLSSVSWFMGTLCENISRRCNRESGSSGAFREHRFKCRSLVDHAAMLICGVYVDLNPIRAGEALMPEQAHHTSAYNRIQGLKQRRGRLNTGGQDTADSALPDRWLCELTLADGTGSAPAAKATGFGVSWRASDKGLLPITLEKYLQLLDWTGRQVRAGKRGVIPQSLAPILDRLGINSAIWLDAIKSFDQWFGLVVGSTAAVAKAAQRAARCRFRGQAHCAATFH